MPLHFTWSHSIGFVKWQPTRINRHLKHLSHLPNHYIFLNYSLVCWSQVHFCWTIVLYFLVIKPQYGYVQYVGKTVTVSDTKTKLIYLTNIPISGIIYLAICANICSGSNLQNITLSEKARSFLYISHDTSGFSIVLVHKQHSYYCTFLLQ